MRSIYAAWDRGDYSSVEWADPEIEYVTTDGPAPGRWRGVAAMAQSWRDFLSAWEGHRTQAEEYRELDGGRVLVLASASARGKRSGMEVEPWVAVAAIFEVGGGKVTRLVIYMDRDRALADLGLTE